MFSEDSIIIQLDSRLKGPDDMLEAIKNHFDKTNTTVKFLSKGSMPLIEVENKKYYAVVESSVGAFIGVQKIKLVPVK